MFLLNEMFSLHQVYLIQAILDHPSTWARIMQQLEPEIKEQMLHGAMLTKLVGAISRCGAAPPLRPARNHPPATPTPTPPGSRVWDLVIRPHFQALAELLGFSGFFLPSSEKLRAAFEKFVAELSNHLHEVTTDAHGEAVWSDIQFIAESFVDRPGVAALMLQALCDRDGDAEFPKRAHFALLLDATQKTRNAKLKGNETLTSYGMKILETGLTHSYLDFLVFAQYNRGDTDEFMGPLFQDNLLKQLEPLVVRCQSPPPQCAASQPDFAPCIPDAAEGADADARRHSQGACVQQSHAVRGGGGGGGEEGGGGRWGRRAAAPAPNATAARRR